MLVGIGKSCWYHWMNYLVMDLWKSRFVESDLGNVINALSCVEHDTPSYFPWKQPQPVSLLFQGLSLGQVLLKMFFLLCQSNKEIHLNTGGGREQKRKNPGDHTSEKYFPVVLWFSCFSSWIFYMLTLGLPPTPFLLHFMTNHLLKIGWEQIYCFSFSKQGYFELNSS